MSKETVTREHGALWTDRALLGRTCPVRGHVFLFRVYEFVCGAFRFAFLRFLVVVIGLLSVTAL